MMHLGKLKALIFHMLQICSYSRIPKRYKNLPLLCCCQMIFGGKKCIAMNCVGKFLNEYPWFLCHWCLKMCLIVPIQLAIALAFSQKLNSLFF